MVADLLIKEITLAPGKAYPTLLDFTPIRNRGKSENDRVTSPLTRNFKFT